MKRIISALFALLIVCLSAVSAGAIDYGCDIEPVCDAVYIEELNTGSVVMEYYASESYKNKIYPASTTKVMTYIIVAENVADLDNTYVDVTYDALANLDPESSVMGLQYHIGESFSVRDLLYGLMLPSGNDAALVLAEYVGKSVSGFVDLMNQKAAQLGCENTHFTSPHGLHSSQHYTTLRDLAVITKYAMKLKDFMTICNTVSYCPDSFNEAFKNTNYLLDSTAQGGRYYFPYAKGIKTGFTDEAGKCLISTAEKDGYTYLCIAMGADYSYAEDINYAMLDTVKLYNWMFDNLQMTTAYDSADVLKSIPVQYVWGDKKVDLVPQSAVTSLLPKEYDAGAVSIRIDWTLDVATAPVAKGDVYGTLTVCYQDEVIGKTNIVAAEDVERQYTNYLAHRVIDIIRDHIVLFVILVLAIIVVIILLIRASKRRKARRARHNRAGMNR